MANASTSPAVVVLDQLRCDGSSRAGRAAAAAKDPVVCGGHGRILCCAQRDEAQLVTDSLVVASMVGGSGHGAGASCAGQMGHMDSHDGDFAY